jgi:hypothetical protein
MMLLLGVFINFKLDPNEPDCFMTDYITASFLGQKL